MLFQNMITRKCMSLISNRIFITSQARTDPRLRNVQKQFLSTSSPLSAYSDTVSNLRIGQNTRVIFQGFTGRQATQNAKQSIEYGTKIVGGVTPGRNAEHLGLPVLPSVRAVSETFTIISFSPTQKRDSNHASGKRSIKAGCDSHLRGCPARRWSHRGGNRS